MDLPIKTALALMVALGRVLPAQVISVSVRDTAGRPIAQVSLVLIDTGGRVVATARTGEGGAALWPRADSGVFQVMARRFGYRPARTAYLRLQATDTIAVRLYLERAATVMDPVLITAQRDTVRRSTAFGINLRATGGYIITPSEIDFAIPGARDVADVLARQAVPGMRVDQVRRCLVSNRGRRCLPVVIDGQLFPDGTALQDIIVPEMIDYMVILRGSEVGVRYGSIGLDGILLIATRRDWVRGPR